jgi:radical SAM superfamily enzyme YgiQ (UPF0313 family)
MFRSASGSDMDAVEVRVPQIVLATVNARYPHTAFGLRYLLANLGPLADRTAILELDGRKSAAELARLLVQQAPSIVGLGVYVWNVALLTEVAQELKRARPDALLLIGGPEVSHELEGQALVALADYVITGEAELALPELCGALLERRRPPAKVIAAVPPSLVANEGGVRLPYHLYTDEDLRHRVVYVEASRGCAFACDFCLSALDRRVRRFPVAPFLDALDGLLRRGCSRFKFVDRTFNLDVETACRVLDFFRDRLRPGLFLHFEMVPDRFPEELRRRIIAFPPGVLHLEVGVQTFNDEVAARIHRPQVGSVVEANLRFLLGETGAQVHADLILGLPGEDLPSIAASFDRLVALRPHELQVGVLKRLRGAPIGRHDLAFAMAYNPAPPYDVLSTSTLDAPTCERLKRFARYWDVLAHAGFGSTRAALWRTDPSPFRAFAALGDWLFESVGRTHAIPLQTLSDLLVEYLASKGALSQAEAVAVVTEDYQRPGRRDWPRGKRKG